jgi:ABC-type transporter lipoprotein component MlaA
LEKTQEDFGQTLAVWGTPKGAYVVLPVLGSSTLRDVTGKADSNCAISLPNVPISPILEEKSLTRFCAGLGTFSL